MLRTLMSATYAEILLLTALGASPAIAQAEPLQLAVHEGARTSAPIKRSSPALQRVISLSLHNVLVADALEEVGRRADLPLVYSRALLPPNRRISLRAKHITAAAALNRVLEGTGLTIHVLSSGQVVVAPERAAASSPRQEETMRLVSFPSMRPVLTSVSVPVVQGTVRGRVVDAASGQPLAGVSVSVVGSGLGALTGSEGIYTIAGVPAGRVTLRAALIGYAAAQQTVVVNSGETATVNFALNQEAITLEGVVAVGYGTQERSNVTGSIASVSPERLERAPNTSVEQALQASVPGVSVQTSGAGAEPDYNILVRGRNSIRASNAPLVVVDGIPYNGPLTEINLKDVASMDVLKDASAAAIYGARGANGVILINTKKGVEGEPRFSYEGYGGIQEAINLPRLMTGAEQAAWRCEYLLQGQDCATRLFTQTELEGLAEGRTTDWYDLALRTGTQQQHTLSFSSGAGGTRYYLSGSLLDVDGVAKNDQFQRASLRVNLDQEVTPWLQIGTSNQLSNTDRSGLPASFGAAFRISPLTIPFDAEGNQMIFPWPEDPFFGNPLEGLLAADDDVTRRAISSNYLELRIPFVEGLSYRLNGGLDFGSRDFGRYYGRNTKTGLEAKGLALTQNTTLLDWTVENIVRYSRDFGAHTVNLTALASTEGNRREQENLRAEGFPNDVLTYYQANVASLVQPTTDFSEWRLNSQMGRLNYQYDGRYLLTLTVRRDGFSGFGRNQKYGVFPSVALGWNVSSEPFWPFGETLSFLKLRASYGENGNQAITPYQTLARLGDYSYIFGATTAPGFVPATLANPDLRWESTTSTNLGADFGFLDRVWGSVDVYVANTDDLLLNRLVSPVHGITSITENIGAVRNRGIEFSLSSTNLERGDFAWSTDLNVSANRNEITALYGDGDDDVANQWFIGQPIDVNYGYVMNGIWQQGDNIAQSAQPDAKPGDVRIRDLNGDGRISPDDRGFIGKREPSYAAGMNNSLRYGNLSLDVFLQTVQGVTRRNTLLSTWPYEGRGNTILLDYWSPTSPSNTIPANRFDSNPLEAGFYQDASYVRLRDATLSFDIPESLAARIGVESLRLHVSGRNLWTSTDWTGLDPELGDQYAVPLERVFTAGASVRF